MALNKLNVDKNKVYIGKTWEGGTISVGFRHCWNKGFNRSSVPLLLLLQATTTGNP